MSTFEAELARVKDELRHKIEKYTELIDEVEAAYETLKRAGVVFHDEPFHISPDALATYNHEAEDFEFTGEFREPKAGEYFLMPQKYYEIFVWKSSYLPTRQYKKKRLIMRPKLKQPATLADTY